MEYSGSKCPHGGDFIGDGDEEMKKPKKKKSKCFYDIQEGSLLTRGALSLKTERILMIPSGVDDV